MNLPETTTNSAAIALLLIFFFLFGQLSHAQDGQQYIKKVLINKLYLYDKNGNETGEKITKNEILKGHVDILIDGKETEVVKIIESNSSEGLIAIQVNGKQKWIELIAVETWPGNKLDCPDTITAQAEKPKQGVTIGFGNHCN